MEDQFSNSSFEEANRLIHSAFNSNFAMNHAKNVAIRKQLLEAAIQKLLESKTFYISDVRDIAAMNNRVFDSRTKLYEQLNILNCREYRKMRAGVLDLLPLMIHRATGIPEQRFAVIVESNRSASDRPVSTVQADSAATVTSAATATAAAVKPVEPEKAAAGPATPQQASPAPARAARPWPLLLSLGLNLVLGVALLTVVQQNLPGATAAKVNATAGEVTPVSTGAASGAATPKSYVVDSLIRTDAPAVSLERIAAELPAGKGNSQQYLVGVRVEKVLR